MKSMNVLLFSAVLSASTATLAQGTLSVSDWSKQLSSSLLSGKATDVQNSLDLKTLEGRALAVQNPKDRQTMTRARLAYKAGRFDEAIRLYNEIPKSSDSWLEAVEEKGWAYLLKKDTEKALAQTKTLLSPTFLPIVGAEPFLLQTLSQLRVCDYNEILKTNKTFKDSQRTRLMSLQDIADGKGSPALDAAIKKVKTFPMKFTEIGEEAKLLPRLFYRDIEVQRAILRLKMAEAGLPILQGAVAEHKTKFKTLSTQAIARLQANANKARLQLAQRIKALAQAEIDESFLVIQRLNLIEVETIQRVHADQKLDRNLYAKGQFARASQDQMVFPDDGHPWIDELDKYQVQVNACPSDVRRKM